MSQIKRIAAKDVMRRNVATVAPQDTIASALELFEEEGISGAPVVDSLGEIVGVITMTDIARPDHLDGSRIAAQRGTFEMVEPDGDEGADEVFFRKNDYSAEALGRERVCDWMTSDVISVPPDSTLEHVCNVMVANKIHRVFIAEDRKLIGIVTSFDVVRTVATQPQRAHVEVRPRRRAAAR
jgi:CBS domain-containing protein